MPDQPLDFCPHCGLELLEESPKCGCGDINNNETEEE